MVKGVARNGVGTRQPQDAPPGMRHHSWVAAATIPVAERDVATFARKAACDTKYGRVSSGHIRFNGLAEVLDCYCERCGVRAGRTGNEWCPRMPSKQHGMP